MFGEVINGIHFIKDFTASITNFLGGRAEEYEQELVDARANAIVGVKIDIETIGQGDSVIMVIAAGTAVVVD